MRMAGSKARLAEAPECSARGGRGTAARVLLDPTSVRGALPKVALLLMVLNVLNACILPPEGLPPPDDRNFPPEVSLDDLVPAAPITPITLERTPTNLCDFFVSAGKVVDRDSPSLRFRWVADNGRSGLTRLLPSTTPEAVLVNDPRCAGPCTLVQFRLFPRLDFKLGPDPRGEPHSLSLFITDAPGWAIPNPGPFQETDLGKIATRSTDGGSTPGSGAVIEVRWVFSISSGAGVCP